MSSQNLTERMRLAALAAGHTGRAVVKTIVGSAPVRWVAGPPMAHQLLLIPQDLRTADPSLAAEMYDGYMGLAGTVAPIGSLSPFSLPPKDKLWQRELHAFGWLRDLHAAQDDVARERAKGLVRDWIALGSSTPEVAWETDVAARRLIAWLSHSGFLLDRAETDFYDAFMSSLTRQFHMLSVTGRDEAQNLPKLRALIATTLASVCVAEFEPYLATYIPALCTELDRQLLADGGHVSRNPGALVELLLDLLPLKQCFVGRAMDPPEALYEAINKIMPMIRFMRLGNGSLARFNGMGATRVDHVATVLAYDDTRPLSDIVSEPSGYARLARGNTVVIADMGQPPPLLSSDKAGAGCLSFELSSGVQEIIVNCGSPKDEDSEWHIVSRATAAHSTLTVDDTSSSRLIKRQLLQPQREVYLLSNPKAVLAKSAIDDDDIVVRAAHDGYKDRFGFIHQRSLRLASDGGTLEGVDELIHPRRGETLAAADSTFAIRFHLHPRVTVGLMQENKGVLLTLPDGERWHFRAQGARLDIEESIFLADPIFRRRCLQIVLSGPCYPAPRVEWLIRKLPTPPSGVSRSLLNRDG